MKIAAQLYTVRDLLGDRSQVGRVLWRLRELGYEHVEVAGIHPSAAELAAAGVGVCASHESLDSLTHQVDEVVDRCLDWTCRYVVVPSVPDGYRSADGFRRFAAEASDIAAALRPHGIRLAYHNHDFELGVWDGEIGLETIFDSASAEDLLAELDTYWLQFAGANPLDWIRRFSSRLPLVHLKDMTLGGRQTEVGRGVTDWPAVLSACRDAGTEWLIVEQDECEGDPLESLAITWRNLARLLN
jgi:sugar phosphate isomerase/epimerase